MKNNTYEKEKIMTEFEKMRRLSERNKRLYLPGTRIELLHMADEPGMFSWNGMTAEHSPCVPMSTASAFCRRRNARMSR